MSDIFISYKREEQATARKLADALEREGWTVWWDPKLRAGERFNDVIEKALKESKCVVVMWSKRSVQSQYVKDEATYALNRNKLVPVMIEEVQLPFRFEGLHTPSLLGWDGSKDFAEFRRLIDDISTILGSSPIAPAEAEERRKDQEVPNRWRRYGPVAAAAVVVILFSFVFWWPKRQETERVEKQQPLKEVPVQAPAEPVLSAGKVFRDRLKSGRESPEMVEIPAGSFRMGNLQGDGSKDELPVRTVRIEKLFAIGRYEVTFQEYDQFAKATNRQLPSDAGWGRGLRPVMNVSWQDSVEYAKWLSEQTGKRYRLPTEAEWEYAVRAATETPYWWGNQIGFGMANCNDCGSQWDWKETAPVGSFKPNPFGLYDTAGNVWERVEDCWHNNYNGAPTDGSAWKETGGGNCGQRVMRGGSWAYRPPYLRASSRHRLDADYRDSLIGFRLAQDLD